MAHQVIFRKKTSAIIPVTGDALVTSLSFVSTSGASPANVPHRFWMGFPAGAIPSGFSAVLKNNGVEAVTQYDQVSTHSDGSLRSVVFRAFISSLPAFSTWKWDIYRRPQPYSAAGLRSTSDITAHDFKTLLTDVRDQTGAVQGSGNYTCSVNTNLGFSPRVRKIATGPNCDVWRVWGKATDNSGGAEHAFLTQDDCIEVWTDPTNPAAVYAISHSGWLRTGWRNVASPGAYTFKATRNDGASVLVTLSGDTFNFTSADVDTVGDAIGGNFANLRTGEMTRLTTTGTLPGGLSTLTNYWTRNAGFGSCTLWGGAYDAFEAGNAGPRKDITSGGTGTHTATRYSYLYYRTGLHTRGTDGKELWTANQPLLDPAFTTTERTYLSKAGFAWPFDYTVTPTNLNSVAYFPGNLCWPAGNISDTGNNGYLRSTMDGTGEHNSLYIWGSVGSTAWLTMNSTDLSVARILGLCASHMTEVWLDETLVNGQESNRCLTLNNGSDDAGTAFSGMGTPLGNQGYYQYSGNFFGCQASPNLGTAEAPNSVSGDGSHWPQTAFVAYMLTGDPHLLDALYFTANFALWRTNVASQVRTKAFGGITYYANWPQWIQQRSDAYSGMHNLYAAICAPDGTGENAYFGKMLNDALAYEVAFRAAVDVSYRNYGHWTPYTNAWDGGTNPTNAPTYFSVGGFQADVVSLAHQQISKLWRTTNAQTMADHFNLFQVQMATPGTLMGSGPFRSNFYYACIKDSPAATTWYAPAKWGEGAGSGTEDLLTWGASNVITFAWGTNTSQVGDKVIFLNDGSQTVPPEITIGHPYTIKTLGGSSGAFTMTISDDGGTTTKTFTANSNHTPVYFLYAATGSGFNASTNIGYAQMETAVLVSGKAWGFANMGTLGADMQTRLAFMGNPWPLSFDPRFAFSPTVL